MTIVAGLLNLKLRIKTSEDNSGGGALKPRRRSGLLRVLAWLAAGAAMAAQAEVASLYSAQGRVEQRLDPAAAWSNAVVGYRFEGGQACRTGTNSRGAVLFVDGVLVRLRETSMLEFKAASAAEKQTPLRLESGAAYFFSREPKRFPKIDTPVVSAAVRGTEFVVAVTPTQTVISVIDGVVECANEFGQLQVTRGEQAVTIQGAAPVKRILVRPWDAVQWALYYPAVLDAAELAQVGFPDEATRRAMEESSTAYRRGDYPAAFAALDQVAEPKPPAIQLHQTALYLGIGEVLKAEALLTTLDASLAVAAPELKSIVTAVSKSQRAIVALINNRRDEALVLAQQAVDARPVSATAALAMSYAQQGRFNLKEARQWVERALALQPESAPIHARLAELQLGFGELNAAARTVAAGLAITPDDSRLLTVAGFAHLTRHQTARATGLFDRALALGDSSGLPHLGRGLALIRQNQLAEGRRELEIAAHLEPTESLFRSYLGKAFFEEKRDALAAREYELARLLDPLDPTPYLYSAYHKLANHRPVEALGDIEDSIQRNNNRAVYRSRLLLDQDEAVRSVGLSQVFNQIGFAEAGRIEAIKSINRDYNNFSAHLLLSGSYFERPQLSQAVISEQLVARLLAPVNLNSVRGEASFNEYSSLFDRQRTQFFLLSEGRSADEFIQAAPRVTTAFDGLAMAFVYGARYQGGYRDNDHATLLSPAALAQFQITPTDTLSLETLQFDVEEGDTTIGFDPRQNDPDFEREVESFTQRVGWHHRFGPGSHLISQFLYLHRNLQLRDFNEPSRLAVLFPGATQDQVQRLVTEGVRADLQHIWDSPGFTLVTGGSLLAAEDRKREATTFHAFGSFTVPSAGTTPADAQRVYVYPTWHLGAHVDLTTGISYGRIEYAEASGPPFDNVERHRDAVSPKAGLVWRATPSTTLRGAYYETLGAAGSADLEGIEPTQVAGFNQLFDDPMATRGRGAGMGLDHKLAKQTYAGAEVMWRELRSPFGLDQQPTFGGGTPNDFMTGKTREQSIRTYLYQVVHRTTTATAEYTLLDQEQDTSKFTPELRDLTDDHSRTHRVRLGLNYFHPRGWFAGLSATWRHQELSAFDAADGVVNDTRDFWIVDATVGYQFPRRRGYLALNCNNLFDQSFRYQPVGMDQRFLPDFSVGMRLSLNY